jgi:hypothetical protein
LKIPNNCSSIHGRAFFLQAGAKENGGSPRMRFSKEEPIELMVPGDSGVVKTQKEKDDN